MLGDHSPCKTPGCHLLQGRECVAHIGQEMVIGPLWCCFSRGPSGGIAWRILLWADRPREGSITALIRDSHSDFLIAVLPVTRFRLICFGTHLGLPGIFCFRENFINTNNHSQVHHSPPAVYCRVEYQQQYEYSR